MVMRSFHEHQMLKIVKKHSTMVADFNGQISALKSYASSFSDATKLAACWFQMHRKLTNLSVCDIDLKSRSLTLSTDKEPVAFESVNSALSFHFLGTKDHEDFFGNLSLALAVNEMQQLLDCITSGKFGLGPKRFQDWLDAYDKDTLEKSLLASVSKPKDPKLRLTMTLGHHDII
uniref:Uncharacterized protein n=1 Tax=Clytia hemisphaerica TaxID=252671 RepID=A0A7M5XIP4_9CNID